MENYLVSSCPFLRGSNEGARCAAITDKYEKNLIRDMEDVNIKLCINKKRRFEACRIYSNFLKDLANQKNSMGIENLKTNLTTSSICNF